MSNEAAPSEWVVVTDRDCQPAHDSPRVDLSRCETWHTTARHRPSGGPPAWVFSLRRTPGGRWFELQESFSGWTLTVRRAHWIADAELTPFWDSHPEITPPDDVVAANTAHDATELPPSEEGSQSPALKARSTSTEAPKRIESEAPPSAAPEPPAVATPKPHEGEAVDFAAIADRMLRERHAKSAALVRFMARLTTASFEDVGNSLYDSPPNDTSIRALVNRTNNALHALGSTLRFTTSGRHVLRRIDPE